MFRYATAIKFLYNRVRFYRPDGTKGMQHGNGSMLVAYGRENAMTLLNNTLKGKFVVL